VANVLIDFVTGKPVATGGAHLSYIAGQGVLMQCVCGATSLLENLQLDDSISHGECPACGQPYAVVVWGGVWPVVPVGLRHSP
jgi:hypothetical protein